MIILRKFKFMDPMPYLINAIVVIIVGIAFPLAGHIPPFGELIRWLDTLAYRWQISLAPSGTSGPVTIVHIDAATLGTGQYRIAPIDRDLLARLIERAAQIAPKAIVVDVDVRFRLRDTFRNGDIPVSDTYLNELDRKDERLSQAVNAALRASIPVILASGADQPLNTRRMSYAVDSPHLYFGAAWAWTNEVDRVIYRLPTFEEAVANLATPQSGSTLEPAKTPSLALAAWAGASGIPSETLATGIIPDDIPEQTAKTLTDFRDGNVALVNWARLFALSAPSTQRLAALVQAAPDQISQTSLNSISAMDFLSGEKKIAEGQVIVLGRTHFADVPVLERPDKHLTPFPPRAITGVELQALFIDNLMTGRWFSKGSWLSGLLLGAVLGIVLGGLFLFLGQWIEHAGLTAGWTTLITNPILSFALGLTVSIAVALLINVLFMQKGMYMLSITLIPLSGLLEAIVYTVWSQK